MADATNPQTAPVVSKWELQMAAFSASVPVATLYESHAPVLVAAHVVAADR